MSNCSGNCEGCASKGNCSEEKHEPLLKTVKKAVLVLSGKGGVGKSTVAASLAVTLAKMGKKVGLLDVDFHGPSQPTLFNVTHLRMCGTEQGMEPLEVAGVKLVSIGLLLDDPDRAIIWRGPVKMGAVKQLLEEVDWGELDVLVLDFPPGTGDESLSACQLIDCEKTAVVVTTPGMFRADLTTISSTSGVMTTDLPAPIPARKPRMVLVLISSILMASITTRFSSCAFALRTDFIASLLTFLLRV